MGALSKQLNQIDHVKNVISHVFYHFDRIRLDERKIRLLSAAADLAFSDSLLFEKFEIWDEEHDDDAFLFHIEKFFEKLNHRPLKIEERDLTSQRERIETSIKEAARHKQKKIFSERITQLAIEHDLLTNDQLGAFLGVSAEQARKYRSGENKPQLATLKQISDKFKVSIEFLSGISIQR